MNSLFTISPYKPLAGGLWVFDDSSRDLTHEPFVDSATDVIDLLVKKHLGSVPVGLPFQLVFSDEPFPGGQECFLRQEAEFDGNWYSNTATGDRGWLCPALIKYFPEPPPKIYLQLKKVSKE